MPKNILVADDEVDTGNFIKKILERRGHNVSVIYDGLEAKKLIERKKFDLIFLDCSMPGITGPELIGFIRKESPQSKVIIFTGYSVIDDRFANDLGADKFLQKPLTVEMIEKCVNQLLDIKDSK